MLSRLSRRKIAEYYAASLIGGADAKILAMQLAGYLIDTKRTKELDDIVSDIEYYLSIHGVVSATVTSAHELSSATKSNIIAKIKDGMGAKTVQLHEVLDKNVLGGVKLQFAGSEIDTTIARQLNMLKTNYKK
jgi:F-type H+-transporting ATPase subunit delta